MSPRRRSTAKLRFVLVTLAAASALLGSAPAEAVKRRAFATSATGTGNLNSWPQADGLFGVAAGDRICQNLAAAAELDNADQYRAWLSAPTLDAYCHVQGLDGTKEENCDGLGQGAGPWFQLAGAGNYTGTLDELTGPEGIIFRGVFQDEEAFFLDPPSIGTYWTGTSRTGEALADTCSGWVVGDSGAEGGVGELRASAARWSDRGFTGACNTARRLLCLERGASEAPAPTPWQPAAIAFVTRAAGNSNFDVWVTGEEAPGIPAADVLCRNQAAGGNLPSPDSFVAWLSDSSVDARDRLTLTNAAYRRVDGYVVANSKTDLIDGTNDLSIHVDQEGKYLTENLGVFTGTLPDGTGSGGDCDDWTNAPPGNSTAGNAAHMRSDEWTDGPARLCNSSNHIYCFSNVETLFWDGFEITGDPTRWSAVTP